MQFIKYVEYSFDLLYNNKIVDSRYVQNYMENIYNLIYRYDANILVAPQTTKRTKNILMRMSLDLHKPQRPYHFHLMHYISRPFLDVQIDVQILITSILHETFSWGTKNAFHFIPKSFRAYTLLVALRRQT